MVPMLVPMMTTYSDHASSTGNGPPAMANPPRTEAMTMSKPRSAIIWPKYRLNWGAS